MKGIDFFYVRDLEHFEQHKGFDSEVNVTLTALRLRGRAQAGCSTPCRCWIIAASCPSLLSRCACCPGPPAGPLSICLGVCKIKCKLKWLLLLIGNVCTGKLLHHILRNLFSCIRYFSKTRSYYIIQIIRS